jgi:acetate kinase
MKILVLNPGSSTQKACLYEIRDKPSADPPKPDWEGKIEWTDGGARIRTSDPSGLRSQAQIQGSSRKEITERLLTDLWRGKTALIQNPSEIDMVGHRVVHGGEEFSEPAFVTAHLKQVVERMAEFAPLHNPASLEGMEIIERVLGRVPQLAVFDTAFHRHLPEQAAVYPGPYEWLARGIRRYGFHGINHQYCAQRAAELLQEELKSLRLVICHLGNGCSLAAVRNGKSIDTTMGFTPLEGLMMGTRGGSLDPGILTFLLRRDRLKADQLDDLLNTHSGLAGVSGISGDMRQIVSAMGEGHRRAKLAFDLFVYRLTSYLGAMVAVLGGIDVLVFTAGIGENSAEVRAGACANLEFLGMRLDPSKNGRGAGDRDVSCSDSRVRILIVAAQEDWAIARACWNLARAQSSPASAANFH